MVGWGLEGHSPPQGLSIFRLWSATSLLGLRCLEAAAGLLSSASPPSPVLGCCVPSPLISHGPSVYLLPTWV